MRKPKSTIAETELYRPVHDYLVAQGYTVRSEVKNCDVVAVRGDDLIVIELKRAMGIQLLAQAVDRQKITDSVYVAVPRPSNMRKWNTQTKTVQVLLKRLEIGLILVSPPFLGEGSGERSSAAKPHPELVEGSASRNGAPHTVQVLFHPVPFTRQKRKSAHRAVLTELNGRSGDYNQGGSTRTKLVTAYREQAIHIACILADRGPLSPKALRVLGTCEKTRSILYTNVYGWFERLGKGLYGISPQGREEISTYCELVNYYTSQLSSE